LSRAADTGFGRPAAQPPGDLLPNGSKELQEAGALYEDSEVVVDGRLVTSRQPADLPAFLRELMKLLSLKGVCP